MTLKAIGDILPSLSFGKDLPAEIHDEHMDEQSQFDTYAQFDEFMSSLSVDERIDMMENMSEPVS